MLGQVMLSDVLEEGLKGHEFSESALGLREMWNMMLYVRTIRYNGTMRYTKIRACRVETSSKTRGQCEI
jgi:hypothetical protein